MNKLKNILFSALTFTCLCTFAQEGVENPYLLICNTNQAEFEVRDIQNCNEVSIRDSDIPVSSFVFAAKKKNKFIEVKVEGNQLTEACYDELKKLKEPRYFRIKNVIDAEGTEAEGFREILVRGDFD